MMSSKFKSQMILLNVNNNENFSKSRVILLKYLLEHEKEVETFHMNNIWGIFEYWH